MSLFHAFLGSILIHRPNVIDKLGKQKVHLYAACRLKSNLHTCPRKKWSGSNPARLRGPTPPCLHRADPARLRGPTRPQKKKKKKKKIQLDYVASLLTGLKLRHVERTDPL